MSLDKVISFVLRSEGQLRSPQSGEELSVRLTSEVVPVPEEDEVEEGGAGRADDWQTDISTLRNVETHQSLAVLTEDGSQERSQGLTAILTLLLSDVKLLETMCVYSSIIRHVRRGVGER